MQLAIPKLFAIRVDVQETPANGGHYEIGFDAAPIPRGLTDVLGRFQ
jgi:hypothetical protein